MSSNWTLLKLSDLSLKITKGTTPTLKEGGFADMGINYIKAESIGFDGRIDQSKFSFISESTHEKLKRSQLQIDDILFSMAGVNLGKTGIVEQKHVPANTNQALALIRPNVDMIFPKYLFYFLRQESIVQYVNSSTSQSAQPNINLKEIGDLEIRFPDLKSQAEIAEILSSLDDKIELNRQTNQTLEQIAQALFKSWFVDFEPTRAKIAAKEAGASPEEIERAAMCAISGKTPDQLAQLPPETQQNLKTTAALFPDVLVDSELGEVPEGWEVKSLSDIAQYANGKIEVSKLNVSNYISTENMLENRGGVTAATSLPSVPTVPSFSPNHILISNIRPYFKKIWLAQFDGGRSNDVLGFVTKEKGCEEFLYNLLYQDEFFEFMMRTSKGAKMPRGDKDAIAGWKFVCASKALRLHFSEIIRPSYSIIESLNSESINLSNARDNLLPKLLSGEIQLQDNEETINV